MHLLKTPEQIVPKKFDINTSNIKPSQLNSENKSSGGKTTCNCKNQNVWNYIAIALLLVKVVVLNVIAKIVQILKETKKEN